MTMNRQHYTSTVNAYVTGNGEWYSGEEAVLTFAPDALTPEQWDILAELHDSDRFDYAHAILLDDEATIARIEKENN
jgi:hypothetical protein